jgi:hypothetical protein
MMRFNRETNKQARQLSRQTAVRPDPSFAAL